jgi:hypothetical protein
MAAEQGPSVLFCMLHRTNFILLVSVVLNIKAAHPCAPITATATAAPTTDPTITATLVPSLVFAVADRGTGGGRGGPLAPWPGVAFCNVTHTINSQACNCAAGYSSVPLSLDEAQACPTPSEQSPSSVAHSYSSGYKP